ncbi:hypothetical protein [Bacillus paranthracis]|uniref:hypothetical protein n=1 Tax=Bacillus paranthracis TaxID=2026186 RepID=UPI0022521B9F|nr:hypothetical protein [Bacillus paranthracis]MCX3317968.1 hypothetical protein [Bacillus paranthracis]MDR0167396.1 hypothetical protein [Bacillus paranthracis]
MPVTPELILFILIAISAVGYLVKEFQKIGKNTWDFTRILGSFLVNMENIDYHNLICKI